MLSNGTKTAQFRRTLPARDQGDGMPGRCQTHAIKCSLRARSKNDYVHGSASTWYQPMDVSMLPLTDLMDGYRRFGPMTRRAWVKSKGPLSEGTWRLNVSVRPNTRAYDCIWPEPRPIEFRGTATPDVLPEGQQATQLRRSLPAGGRPLSSKQRTPFGNHRPGASPSKLRFNRQQPQEPGAGTSHKGDVRFCVQFGGRPVPRGVDPDDPAAAVWLCAQVEPPCDLV